MTDGTLRARRSASIMRAVPSRIDPRMPPALRTVLFNRAQRLRNGWWMLVFVAFFLLSRVAYTPVSRGLQGLGVAKDWLEPLGFGFALLATWACVRLRGETLASVGFDFGKRWLKLLGLGGAIGLAEALVVVALIAVGGGVRLELAEGRSWGALLYGAYMFLFVALLEETLCRGFLFQRLADGAGIWIAQIAFGAVFALGHWDNPGMSGTTKVIASLDLFLGAVMLGLAWLRTHSLALPVGLHLGWNWAQGCLLGFDVSGRDIPGWFHPVLHGDATWLTGGAFGPEASVCSVAIDVVVILALWRWTPRSASVEPVGDAAVETGGVVEHDPVPGRELARGAAG